MPNCSEPSKGDALAAAPRSGFENRADTAPAQGRRSSCRVCLLAGCGRGCAPGRSCWVCLLASRWRVCASGCSYRNAAARDRHGDFGSEPSKGDALVAAPRSGSRTAALAAEPFVWPWLLMQGAGVIFSQYAPAAAHSHKPHRIPNPPLPYPLPPHFPPPTNSLSPWVVSHLSPVCHLMTLGVVSPL